MAPCKDKGTNHCPGPWEPQQPHRTQCSDYVRAERGAEHRIRSLEHPQCLTQQQTSAQRMLGPCICRAKQGYWGLRGAGLVAPHCTVGLLHQRSPSHPLPRAGLSPEPAHGHSAQTHTEEPSQMMLAHRPGQAALISQPCVAYSSSCFNPSILLPQLNTLGKRRDPPK